MLAALHGENQGIRLYCQTVAYVRIPKYLYKHMTQTSIHAANSHELTRSLFEEDSCLADQPYC